MAVVTTKHGGYFVSISDAVAVGDVAKELAQEFSDEKVDERYIVRIDIDNKLAIWNKPGASD